MENRKNTTDFASGSVSGNILAQALPLTLAQLVQLLYNIVDRIYIGHLPGASSLALTGIGLVFPIVTFVASFTYLFSQGGVPLCSIERGRHNVEKAEKILGNTFSALCVSAVLLTIVCYLVKRPVLYLFGASDDTYYYANAYLQIYLTGTLFCMVSTGMNGFINAQGFPRVGMLTTVLGAVLNIILDPILIFGLGLGVEGAALATVISQGMSFLWVMRFLLGERAILRMRSQALLPDFRLLLQIMALGMSGFIMQVTNCAVQVVCNVTLKIYGGDLYIGIMTIVNSVREIVSLPITGITSGSQPVLGFNYGAGKYGRVKQGIWFAFFLGLAYSVLAWLIILLLPGLFIRLFNGETDMLTCGVPALRLYFLAFFFMVFQFSGQSTFVGLGKARYAVFFSLLRKAVIVIPLTLILPKCFSLGVYGVFVAEPISNVLGGCASFFTMLLTVGRELTKRERESEGQTRVSV